MSHDLPLACCRRIAPLPEANAGLLGKPATSVPRTTSAFLDSLLRVPLTSFIRYEVVTLSIRLFRKTSGGNPPASPGGTLSVGSRRLSPNPSRMYRVLFEHSREWPLRVCLALLGWAAVTLFLHAYFIDPWDDGYRAFGLLAGGMDVGVYRAAAERFLEGGPVYAERVLHGLYYLYPPFSIILFLPLTAWPIDDVKLPWFAASAVLLGICILRCFWALGYRMSLRLLIVALAVTVVASFLEPIRTTLFYGQINIILLLLVVFDLTAKRGGLRGLGVGLAAGIKVTPGLFILHYLAVRNLRAVAVASATFAATIVFSWIIAPGPSSRYWLHELTDSSRIALDLHPGNQSLKGMIAHLTASDVVPMWQWPPLALAIGAVGLHYAARLHRRGDVLMAVVLTGMTASMVSPFSWGHHWVWLAPLLVQLIHLARQDPRWWLASALLFVIAGSWVQEFPDVNAVGLFLFVSPWQVLDTFVLNNLFPLGYFVLLISVMWACYRSPDKARAAVVADGRHNAGLDPVARTTRVASEQLGEQDPQLHP